MSGFPTFEFNPATNKFDTVFPQAAQGDLQTQPINPSAGAAGLDSRGLIQILNALSQNFGASAQRQQQMNPAGGAAAPPMPIPMNRNIQPGPIAAVPRPGLLR